jgi:phosphate transport system permease protein
MDDRLARIIARRKRQDALFKVLGVACTLVGIVTLLVLLADLVLDGIGRINWDFFFNYPSRFPDRAGILSAWVGTIAVMFVTAAAAVPLGVAAGVYLEEYAPKNWFTGLIEINISNLAGVPSIVYGLMMLGLLVYTFHMDRSILAAGLTLAFLVLPIVIVATRESLRAIPEGIREAAYALGATRWQVVRHHLLPYSLGGTMTGVIIALSRAVGETAPLITIGAFTYIAHLPPSPIQPDFPFLSLEWIHSEFTVLPIQMFNWISRPQREFHETAAAAGLVLIVVTLLLNGLAIAIRYRVRKRIHW